MTKNVAALVTALVVLAIILIGLYVGKKAGEKKDGFQQGLYKVRSGYFFFLISAIVVLLFITLNNIEVPYPSFQKGAPDVEVKATASTWSWELDHQSVPVGKTVEFSVSTNDVTHGFGIYSPEGKILAQVQVMPGYTNKLRYKFTQPGEYKIFCMEYCGVAHHSMITSLLVTPEGAAVEESKSAESAVEKGAQK